MDKNIRILVTGSTGFLGRNLIQRLREQGYGNVTGVKSSEFDLRKEEDVKRLFEKKYEVVIHLAAIVKGIKFRKENPGKAFYDNLIMNVLMQEYAMNSGVSKFIGLGSVTAYPSNAKIPYQEEEYLIGEPEETNKSYAIAKRLMLQQGHAYRKQSGFNSIHLIMTNMYGPGYDINSDELYVIPIMIDKFSSAIVSGDKEIGLWGSGKATREFLYVDDASDAIILAMEKYDKAEPLNIGSGVETSIKELAEKISLISGFQGSINWDITKPEGKMRNCSNTTRAEKAIGFKAKTSLIDGIKKTIDWYKQNKDKYL